MVRAMFVWDRSQHIRCCGPDQACVALPVHPSAYMFSVALCSAVAAAATAAAMPGTLQPFACGGDAADLGGQTQEVVQATMVFPVLGTLALAGPTPALLGTPHGPGSAAPAPAPTPATAAPGPAAAGGPGAGLCAETQLVDPASLFGLSPAAMQQQLQARLQAALGDRVEEDQGGQEARDSDMEEGQQPVSFGDPVCVEMVCASCRCCMCSIDTVWLQ